MTLKSFCVFPSIVKPFLPMCSYDIALGFRHSCRKQWRPMCTHCQPDFQSSNLFCKSDIVTTSKLFIGNRFGNHASHRQPGTDPGFCEGVLGTRAGSNEDLCVCPLPTCFPVINLVFYNMLFHARPMFMGTKPLDLMHTYMTLYKYPSFAYAK